MSLELSSLLVSVHLTKFTAKRTDKKATQEVIARKRASGDAGRWQTNLLPAGALDPISKIDGEIRRFHYEHTLSWSDDGSRLLPSKKFLDYSSEMRKFKQIRQSRVDDFIRKYADHVDAAENQLGDLFDEANYPSIAHIGDKFTFRWDTAPVPTAGDFRIEAAQEEMEEMEERLAEKLKAAEDSALRDLVDRLADPLSKMAERLRDPDAVFRDSLTTNLRDILKVIPDLNITENSKLNEIATAVKTGVAVFDSEQLRNDKTVRRSVVEKVENHLNQLQSLFPEAA